MNIYAVEKLMGETRRLAAQYYQLTGKVLPVSGELANYDVARLLGFEVPKEKTAGVDLIGTGRWQGVKFIVKSRVIFGTNQSRLWVGQLNVEGAWDIAVLVLMNDQYEPIQIHLLQKKIAEEIKSSSSRRGGLSVAKFKALGELVWTVEDGLIE